MPPLRTRTFFDGESFSPDLVYGGVYYPQHVDPPVVNWSHYSRIVDTKNKKHPSGYRDPGYCSHLKVDATPQRGYSDFNHHPWGDHILFTWVNGDDKPATVTMVGDYFSNHTSVPVGDILAAKLAAWNKFSTQVPEIVSIANFLYELKDFEPVLKNLSKARKILANQNSRRVKNIPSIANSTFLSYNFAWAPFLSDLVKFTQVLDRVHSRLDWLRRNRKKPVSVHYKNEKLAEFSPGSPELVVAHDYPDYTGWIHERRYLESQGGAASFVASAVLYQDLLGLDDAWADFRATLAALGLNNPAKIVWNAIPLSFMLDWIFPVNGFLGRLAVNPFSGKWDIYNVCHSFKRVLTITEYNDYDGGLGMPIRHHMRTHRVEKYDRIPGLPLTFDDVNFTSSTPHQQALFFSLLAGQTVLKRR